MEGGDGGEHRTYNGAIVCCHMSVEEEEEEEKKEEKSREEDGLKKKAKRSENERVERDRGRQGGIMGSGGTR